MLVVGLAGWLAGWLVCHPSGIWQISSCDGHGFGYPACAEGADACVRRVRVAGLFSLSFRRRPVQNVILSLEALPFGSPACQLPALPACLPACRLGYMRAVLAEALGTGSAEGLQAMNSFGRDFTT